MSAVYQTSSVTNLVASTSTVVVNKPSGTVDGDLMVAVIYAGFNSGSQTMTPPAGWTTIRAADTSGGGGAPPTIWSYYRVASSEGSSYTWTISGGLTTIGGAILRITDQAATPILASNGAGTSGGSATNLTFANTVTPTGGYQLILMPVLANSGTGTMSTYAVATSNPTWTELFDNNSAGSFIMSLAYATRTEATATGNSSVTCSDTVESWVSQLIVIDRIYSFSSTITDSVTCTDTHVNNVGFNLTVSDSVTPTETITSEKQKTWATPQKSSTTWTNIDKS